MGKFIYVTGRDARNRLTEMGYYLLKEDSAKQIYVFLNRDNQNFACSDIEYALSDTLTF